MVEFFVVMCALAAGVLFCLLYLMWACLSTAALSGSSVVERWWARRRAVPADALSMGPAEALSMGPAEA